MTAFHIPITKDLWALTVCNGTHHLNFGSLTESLPGPHMNPFAIWKTAHSLMAQDPIKPTFPFWAANMRKVKNQTFRCPMFTQCSLKSLDPDLSMPALREFSRVPFINPSYSLISIIHTFKFHYPKTFLIHGSNSIQS